MGSGLARLSRGRWWLRRHVRVVAAQAGRHTVVVTPRTTVPQVTISVRRHPDAARAMVRELP
jgi:hypothetical protein